MNERGGDGEEIEAEVGEEKQIVDKMDERFEYANRRAGNGRRKGD